MLVVVEVVVGVMWMVELDLTVSELDPDSYPLYNLPLVTAVFTWSEGSFGPPTFWKADPDLDPMRVGRGGGELSVEGSWSIKSYHLSSELWPLDTDEVVNVPPSWTVGGGCCPGYLTLLLLTPLHSCMKLLLLDPVP